MLDVALIWDPAVGEADLATNGGDLATDSGLQTAVIISLFTDRLAEPGDAIPDGSSDRRGTWTDMPLDTGEQDTPPSGNALTGSRLWLLDRALQTQATLNAAEAYANEALAWMASDGVAGSVTATASFPQLGWLQLDIDIEQQGSTSQFSFAWAMSAAQPATAPSPAPFGG